MLLSRDYNHGDSNILNIISTRTITYDYNDEGARTKEVNLVRRRTRMLYSSFGSEYVALHLLVVWLDLDWTWRYGRLLTFGLLSQFGPWLDYLLVSRFCSWVTDGPWLNWGDKPVFTLSMLEMGRNTSLLTRRLPKFLCFSVDNANN